jgi:hypothetical protein
MSLLKFTFIYYYCYMIVHFDFFFSPPSPALATAPPVVDEGSRSLSVPTFANPATLDARAVSAAMELLAT